MRFVGCIIFSLFFCLQTIGQNVDSLEQALETVVDDTVQVDIYYDLLRANEYSNPQKALYYSKQILNHPLNQEPYYKARNYINVGKLFKNVGQFDSAVANMLTGIKIAEKENDFKNKAMGYNSLGIIYKANSDWKNALKFYRLSYIECNNNDFANGVAMTLNNLGTIHDALENRDSAIYYYEKAAGIAEENDLIGAKAVSYNNLGEILAKDGKNNEALEYFYKTLACDSITKNFMGMSYTLYNIITCQKLLGNTKEAFTTLEKAEQISKELGSKQIDLLYQRSLSDMLEVKGDYKGALKAHQRFKALNDSVYNSEKSAQPLILD